MVVPWRLVFYNILAGKDRGPDIFGTEPYHYYLRNLLLNFNIWVVLAIVVAPLVFLQSRFQRGNAMKQTLLRMWVFISPFYIWMAIFTLQPHKEERFMYPAYPFLALNAAIALHIILAYVGSTNMKELMGRIPAKLKLAVIMSAPIFSIILGLLRIVGTVTAYRAPHQIYQALEASEVARPGDTVCFGKDWYRFPSSYFLPNGMRAKFVKSEFSGLLPGEFKEANTGFGFFPGTWLTPPGMNDRNQEDPGKHVREMNLKSGQLADTDRQTSHIAHTSLILIWLQQWHRSWNPTTRSMNQPGNGSPVHPSLMYRKPAC
jgi:alpha-1,2-mannosyltransferase